MMTKLSSKSQRCMVFKNVLRAWKSSLVFKGIGFSWRAMMGMKRAISFYYHYTELASYYSEKSKSFQVSYTQLHDYNYQLK